MCKRTIQFTSVSSQCVTRISWMFMLSVVVGGCKPAGIVTSPQTQVAPVPANKSPEAVEASLEAVVPREQMPKIKDEDLRKLVELKARVTQSDNGKYKVDVRHSPGFTDGSIERVIVCPNVEDLTMERVFITDEGLAKIKDLKLTRLILNGCPITAKSIEMLSAQPMAKTLISLGLKEIPIGDEHIVVFKRFEKLQRLDLSSTLITDASLPTLQLLPLVVLNVTDSKLTPEGIRKLKELKPATQITASN